MRLTHKIYQSIESVWWNKKKPSLLLRGLSYLYKIGSNHDQKTPFTIWLAKQLKKYDFKPVILCRDEAVLLHRISHCPVISAQDRVTASRMAAEYGDIILLDDGFQYRQLQRQCDIVLIPDEGLGNGYLLPAGPLRELPEALNRADIIVRTGTASHKSLTHHKEWHWHTKPQPLNDWQQCHGVAPESVIAVSAIARPQRFTQSLQELGIHVEYSHFFPDHHAFTEHDLRDIWKQKAAIAVTAKDAVKLLHIWPEKRPLWVLEQGFEGEHGLIEAILAALNVGDSKL